MKAKSTTVIFTVIGNNKMFCGCKNDSAIPCSVCAHLPAMLPKINEEFIHSAIIAAGILNMRFVQSSFLREAYISQDGMEYVYSQQNLPLAINGNYEGFPINKLYLQEGYKKVNGYNCFGYPQFAIEFTSCGIRKDKALISKIGKALKSKNIKTDCAEYRLNVLVKDNEFAVLFGNNLSKMYAAAKEAECGTYYVTDDYAIKYLNSIPATLPYTGHCDIQIDYITANAAINKA